MASRIYGIDLGRIIGCFAVIIIHQSALSYGESAWLSEAMRTASRWAVPYFFIVSGYFLNLNAGPVAGIKSMLSRLLPVYIFWVLVYVFLLGDPSSVFHEIFTNYRVIYSLAIHGGSGYHLWFISSLMGAIMAVYFFSSTLSIFQIASVAVILFSYGLVFGSYFPLWSEPGEAPPVNTRYFIFFSFPFVFLGVLIRKYEHFFALRYKKILIFGMATYGLELYLLHLFANVRVDAPEYIASTILVGLGIFFVFRRLLPAGPISDVIIKFGPATLGVYAVHVLVLNYLTDTIVPDTMALGLLVAALTMAVSFSISYFGSRLPFVRRVFT